MKTSMELKTGDYVSVKGNSQGTVWESGYILDINEKGALIGYGSKGTPRNWLLIGMGMRENLSSLSLMKKD